MEKFGSLKELFSKKAVVEERKIDKIVYMIEKDPDDGVEMEEIRVTSALASCNSGNPAWDLDDVDRPENNHKLIGLRSGTVPLKTGWGTHPSALPVRLTSETAKFVLDSHKSGHKSKQHDDIVVDIDDDNSIDEDYRNMFHFKKDKDNQEEAVKLIETSVFSLEMEDRISFHKAARKGDLKKLSLLIENGANPNSLSKFLIAPLHRAAMGGNHTACSLLINCGANVNHEDKYGNSALHYASEAGSFLTCQVLIDAGCQINAGNNNRRSPRDLAFNQKVSDLLTMNGGRFGKDIFPEGDEDYRRMREKEWAIHNPNPGRLFLGIISAKELPALDRGGTSDPYVSAAIGSQVRTTKTKEKELNPVWRELYSYSVENKNFQYLDVRVYDYDRLFDDEILGTCSIKLKDLPDSDGKFYNKWLKLKGTERGRIHLMAYFVPSNSVFTSLPERMRTAITIRNFSDLQQLDGLRDKNTMGN